MEENNTQATGNYTQNAQQYGTVNGQNAQQYGAPNGYGQPSQELEPPVSMGEWMWTMLLMVIPCVNLILAIVWAFSKNIPKSKSNFFKAYLIWILIGIGLSILFSVAFGVTVASIISQTGY